MTAGELLSGGVLDCMMQFVSRKQWHCLRQYTSAQLHSLLLIDQDALEPQQVVNQLIQSNIKTESCQTSVRWSKIAQEAWLLERVLTSPISRELLLFCATINKSRAKLWVITHLSFAASIFRADLLALLLAELAVMLFGASCKLNRGRLCSLWESRENWDLMSWERLKPKGSHSIFSNIIKYRCLKA